MSIEAANPAINATLTASAGSGKTWMLVTRILRLLLAGAEPGSILALTFTRKAAAEMQQRLSERLYAMAVAEPAELDQLLAEIGIQADPGIREQAQGLYEMHQYCDYPVRSQTFHSFCQELLSRFALEADVPPGFELLDSSSLLIKQALDALFNEAARNMDGELSQQLQQLMAACGSQFSLDRILHEFLEHRSDWWAYTEDQDNPCDYAADKLARQLGLDSQQLDTDSIYNDFFSTETIDRLQNYRDLLAKHPNKNNIKKLDAINETLADSLFDENGFEKIHSAFIKKDGKPYILKDSNALRKSLGDDGTDQLLDLHGQIPDLIFQTLDKIHRIQTYQLNRLWYICGQRFVDYYQTLKLELRQLDFTDLEWHSYRLLKNPENAQWIQYKLDQQIRHFLIDEFQDTNPTQWQLILPLLEEMAASEHHDRSVFLVGDEKQSIYSFRRAKPELQSQASLWLQQHLSAKTFPLNKSWRSSPVIIETVNRVFGKEKYRHLLSDFKPHETHRQELYGRVVVLPKIQAEKNDEPEENKPLELRNPLLQPRQEKSSLYSQEGQQIAAAITELIANKATTGSGDECRLINYSDIYILVRKRSHVAAYEQALQNAGIPYIGTNKGSFLDCLEIQDMLALLDSLISPFNNLSLAQVLKSPIFNIRDEDLIKLAAYKQQPLWIERLAEMQKELDEHHPLAHAYRLLQQWRQLADMIPVHDLLDKIYNQSQLINRYIAASPESLKPRVEANLNQFMERALDLDSGRYPSLIHFLQHLRSLKALSDAPDEAPAEPNGSRVKIMTIHASKGLEAPVVFLADTINLTKDKSSLSALVDWPVDQSRPQAFQLIPPSRNRDSLSAERIEQQKQIQQREDANLFYVAITRARQYLYVSACQPEKGPLNDWYEDIFQALQNEDENGEAVYLKESDTLKMPAANPRKEPPGQKDIELDPRLLAPVRKKYAAPMIAPSQFSPQGDTENTANQAADDEDALLRGIGIHRILELLNNHQTITDDHIKQMLAGELQLTLDEPQMDDWIHEARGLLNNETLHSVFYPADALGVFNEIPLHFQQGKQTVFGIIDRLIVHQDSLWIIDYKSHQQARENNLQQLASHYRQQMNYYAKGMAKAWPEKTIRASLLFTHCGQLFDMSIDTNEL